MISLLTHRHTIRKGFFSSAWILIVVCSPSWGESTPLFWKITSAYHPNAELYVLGSMHMGRSDFYPLPEQVDKAFARSDVLAVEIDITAIDVFKAAQTMAQHARLPPGQNLRQQLPTSIWDKLESLAKASALPMQDLQNMKPWFVAMQLELTAFQQRGFSEYHGIDLYFLTRKQKHRVVSIESLDEQLGLFQQLSQEEQLYFLQASLKAFDQIDRYVNEFARVWKQGDQQQMEALIMQNLDVTHPAGKKIHYLLFTRRNQTMIEAAEEILGDGENGFMVVGAAHLLGAEGIIAGLQAREHRVERVVFSR